MPSLRSGGAEKILSLLINYWDRTVYDVRVILVDSRNKFFKLDRKDELIELHKTSPKNAVLPIFKELRKMKPDFVFVSTMKYATLCGYLSIFLPRSLIWICRESNISSLSYQNYYRFPKLMKCLAKFAYSRINYIIAQSDHMKSDFVRFFDFNQNKITVINNPILFSESKSKRTEGGSFRLLSVGRLNQVKGYDRIFNELTKLNLDYTYTILGDGPEKKALRNQAESLGIDKRIKFQGQVEDVKKYYVNSDILLMASRHEGFPNVLLEAGMHGLPVVVFNCPGGTSEIVNHGNNGYLVDDMNDYAEYIEKACHREWDNKSIKHNILEKYDIQSILRKYYKIINNEGSI